MFGVNGMDGRAAVGSVASVFDGLRRRATMPRFPAGRAISKSVVSGIVAAGDATVMLVSGLAALLWQSLDDDPGDLHWAGFGLVLGIVLALNILHRLRAYRFDLLGNL